MPKWEIHNKWAELMGIPKEYALIKKPIFVKDKVPDLRTDVGKEELERIRKDLHDLLWGGGRYQGNEIFNFVMKLFLAKIYSEKETEPGKAYDFQIYYENGNQEKAEKTHARINKLYKKALREYLHFPDKEIKNRDVTKIGDKNIPIKKINHVVWAFQGISLTKNFPKPK